MFKHLRYPLIVCVFLFSITVCAQTSAESKGRTQVKSLKVTILSTMLADQGIGEWRFAALVEADGHRLLVDTGARPGTVLSNIKDLKIDLSDVKEVVLTHNHEDHTGGLIALRREFMKKNAEALSVAHVGKGMFYSRPKPNEVEGNTTIEMRTEYRFIGGK